jgi:multicomponent Na+:H+ antiporter subunit F
MVAGQLFGTVGVAVLLLLAQTSGAPDLRLVALVFALLSAVVSVAFVKRGWVRLDEERHGPSENGSADA